MKSTSALASLATAAGLILLLYAQSNIVAQSRGRAASGTDRWEPRVMSPWALASTRGTETRWNHCTPAAARARPVPLLCDRLGISSRKAGRQGK